MLRTFRQGDTANPGTFETYWEKDHVYRDGLLLATETPTATRHAYLDHLGTPRLWTLSNGSNPVHHSYMAFGEDPVADFDAETHRFTGHERDEVPGQAASCTGTVSVENTTYTTAAVEVACTEISAGPSVTVGSGAEVEFRAGGRVILEGGFEVVDGGEFAAVLDVDLAATDVYDLDYMHARFCSPVQGRFLSPDPKQRRSAAMKPQTWNRYAYARNNPMRFLDPNGLEEITFQLSTAINQATVVAPTGQRFAGGTKTFQQVTIETDRSIAGSNPIVRQSQFVGKTQQRNLFNSKLTTGQAQASASGLTASGSFDAQGNAVLTMGVAAANPMLPALITPEINVGMTVTVDPSGQSFDVSASVDGFPTTAAAAVTSDGQQIPIFLVGASALGPMALVDEFQDQQISVQCTKQDGCEPERE